MFNMRTDADGGIIAEKVDLKMHTCNMGDIEIFNQLGSYQSKISLFYCLDKGQILKLKGDFTQDNQNLFILEWQKCDV